MTTNKDTLVLVYKCRNCDTTTTNFNMVCDNCFRDPETNNCEECGKHLSGIDYPYVCGECIHSLE